MSHSNFEHIFNYSWQASPKKRSCYSQWNIAKCMTIHINDWLEFKQRINYFWHRWSWWMWEFSFTSIYINIKHVDFSLKCPTAVGEQFADKYSGHFKAPKKSLCGFTFLWVRKPCSHDIYKHLWEWFQAVKQMSKKHSFNFKPNLHIIYARVLLWATQCIHRVFS